MMTHHWLGKYPSVDAAWKGYSALMRPPDIEAARLAFWAGASVLFYIMLLTMDPGNEPTDADMARMDRLNAEIEKFASTFDAEVLRRNTGR
jgi:hypothetical protein